MATGQSRAPAPLWWMAMALGVTGIVIAAALLLLREPETRIVEVPSSVVPEHSAEVLAELARIEAETERLSAETLGLLTQVAAYECPPGSEPTDPEMLADIRSRAVAMLESRRQN